MNNLEYKIENNKILIRVDYNIKDFFKKYFKTAKWNSVCKLWELNNTTRTLNKLEKWINEVKGVSTELADAEKAAEEKDLTERELNQIKKEVERMKAEIDYLNEKSEDLKDLKKEIEASKSEVESLKIKLADAQAKKDLEEKEIIEFVDSLINTSKLESISSTINSYARKSFLLSREKADLRELLAYAHEACDILEEAGFKSKNITRLSNTAINRLDRDNFNFSRKDFYDIEKIEA